jgi:DNA-binding MarR family transcriptional regulator
MSCIYTTTMKKSCFDVAASCLCTKIRKAARAITSHYDDALKPCGLRSTQFTLLVAASVGAESSISELAEQLGMDRTTLSRNIKPWERDGYITLGTDHPGRTVVVTLTPKGARVLERALPMWHDAQRRLTRRFGTSDTHELDARLDRLATMSAARRLR